MTCRALCMGDFLEQIARLAESPVKAIVLREKDLPEDDYERLANSVLALCRGRRKPCILHTHTGAAMRLGCRQIHLPLALLRELPDETRRQFDTIGVSVHSASQAIEAAGWGASYLTAGHIFDTDCKAGMPGRGLDFLRQVCSRVSIPVYAIGGITPGRMPSILQAGARGGCMMSSLMRCADPTAYLQGCAE